MADNDNPDLERQFRELQDQNHELAKEVAVLRADMNTNYAETESALDRLRADMADWKTDMADWKTDMARRDTDMARRDKDNLRWTVGFGIAQIAVTVTILAAGFAFLALVGIPAK